MNEVEVTYLDGPYIAVVTGRASVVLGYVFVETDGAAFRIDARLVIAIRPA